MTADSNSTLSLIFRSGTLPSGDKAVNQSGLLARIDDGAGKWNVLLSQGDDSALDVGAQGVTDEFEAKHGSPVSRLLREVRR